MKSERWFIFIRILIALIRHASAFLLCAFFRLSQQNSAESYDTKNFSSPDTVIIYKHCWWITAFNCGSWTSNCLSGTVIGAKVRVYYNSCILNLLDIFMSLKKLVRL